MKKIALLIIVLMPIFAGAQEGKLVKDAAVWRETITQLVNPPSQFHLYKFQYLMLGDTTIDNETYKKVYSTDYDSTISNLLYIGAMRETMDGKVYFRQHPDFHSQVLFYYEKQDTTETLLYDFSLNANDTFRVSGVAEDSVHIVDFVDSVQIANVWRKRINFKQSFGDSRVWVEGIGSEKGLFFPHLYEFENSNQLICYEDSNVFWSPANVTVDCYKVGLEEESDLADATISLYPNPASTFVSIEIKNTDLPYKTAELYTFYGSLIEAIEIQSPKFEFNLNHLSKGIYFIKLKAEHHTILKKVIKY